jgi:hypothetical protein
MYRFPWIAKNGSGERRQVLKNTLALLTAFLASHCIAAPVVSGDYEGLLIGVDRNGVLTGYFESSTGRGKFSCIFFISGKVSDQRGRVETWFPNNRDAKMVIQGVLEGTASDEVPLIRLKLSEDHGGCWNVQHFAPDPATFALTEQGSWESIRIVAASKAYFYDDPSNPKPRKAFVVTGNALRVYEIRGAWARVEYVGPDNRRSRGWVLTRDLFSAKSPGTEK